MSSAKRKTPDMPESDSGVHDKKQKTRRCNGCEAPLRQGERVMMNTPWNAYANRMERDDLDMLCFTCWKKAGEDEKRAKPIFSDEFVAAVHKIDTEYKKIDPETCTFVGALGLQAVDVFCKKWRSDRCAAPDCKEKLAPKLVGMVCCRPPAPVHGILPAPRVCDRHKYHQPGCDKAPRPKARATTIAKHEANKTLFDQFATEFEELDDKRKAAIKKDNNNRLFDWFQREREKIEYALSLDPRAV